MITSLYQLIVDQLIGLSRVNIYFFKYIFKFRNKRQDFRVFFIMIQEATRRFLRFTELLNVLFEKPEWKPMDYGSVLVMKVTFKKYQFSSYNGTIIINTARRIYVLYTDHAVVKDESNSFVNCLSSCCILNTHVRHFRLHFVNGYFAEIKDHDLTLHTILRVCHTNETRKTHFLI